MGFHLANTVLVLGLLVKTTGSFWRSFWVAALFALHPMNVESVAWLAERKNLLSSFLAFSSLLFYAHYAHSGRLRHYAAVFFLFLLGLLAKPSVVVLPILMMVMDYWPLKRWGVGAGPTLAPTGHEGSCRRPPTFGVLVGEKLPLLALSGLTAVTVSHSMSLRGIDISYAAMPLGMRLVNAATSINGYLGKLLWPTDLMVFYPYPQGMDVLHLSLALVVLLGISALVLAGYRRVPYALFGWTWFLISLAPMLGIKQAGLWPALADRWAYVPYVGLFAALIWGLARLRKRYAVSVNLAAIVGVSILVLFAAFSYRQVSHWQNSLTLFQHAVRVDPDNDVAHNNLGAAYYQDGQVPKALFHFLEALRIQPGYQAAHDNLDAGLIRMGHGQQLEVKLAELIRLNPDMAALDYHLGFLLEKQGDLKNAERHYENALQKNPGYIQALNAVCRVLMGQQDYSRALVRLKQRAALAPVNGAVFYEIGRLYAHFGDIEAALRWLKQSRSSGVAVERLLDEDPLLKNVRQHPAFNAMRRSSVGEQAPSQAKDQ
jgi:Tfp pilus assembly protein PilF